jgi:Domain of unknown function (DUF1844)
MSDKQVSEPDDQAGMGPEDMMSALFAQMVIQQANMAMMLLGKVPHPRTGKTEQDIDAARMFIDQLEMLEVKTKGNLSREEEQLLKQSLMALRMAFVESVEAPASKTPADAPETAPEAADDKSAPEAAAADEQSKKKFSKKY